MVDEGTKVIFQIKGLSKTRRLGSSPPVVELYKFDEDPTLDPIACLNEYLARTQTGRPVQGCQLFLTSNRPFKPVKSSTISGWLRDLMNKAGIDTEIWKPHSTRGLVRLKPMLRACQSKIF